MSHAKRRDRLGAWATVDAETAWDAEDGSGLCLLDDGSFLRICGWDQTNGSNRSLYRSDDRGVTWESLALYPGTARHAMPCPEHRVGNRTYAYVIGSDAAAGAVGDIRRTHNGESWETVTTVSPTTNWVNSMAVSYAGRLHILGGQSDGNSAASASSRHFRSVDPDGADWEELDPAPWAGRGIGGITVFNGELVVIAGGASDSVIENETYYDDAWSWNGTTWTQRAALNNASITAVKYTSAFTFHGCLWLANGSGTGRTNIKQLVCTKDYSNWFNCTNFMSCTARHADSWAVDSLGILHLGGLAGNSTDKEVHRWDLI
jgi:hypothetical protein